MEAFSAKQKIHGVNVLLTLPRSHVFLRVLLMNCWLFKSQQHELHYSTTLHSSGVPTNKHHVLIQALITDESIGIAGRVTSSMKMLHSFNQWLAIFFLKGRQSSWRINNRLLTWRSNLFNGFNYVIMANVVTHSERPSVHTVYGSVSCCLPHWQHNSPASSVLWYVRPA